MTDASVSVRCECTPVCDIEFGNTTGWAASEAVITAVAALEGVPPTKLSALYHQIDPHALDRMFADARETDAPTKLCTFTYCGWKVFVRDDGSIRICDPDLSTEPAPAFEKSIGGPA